MAPDRRLGDPTRVVVDQTARRSVRSGAVWGLVFGAYVAASAIGFATSYPTAAARAKLVTSLGGNAGLAALLGPARHIDTVAGFTAWRAMAVLTVVGAVWALFLATRLLRGEEDAGRWELYLAGQTTRKRAAAQAVVGLFGGVAVLGLVTALLTVAVGRTAKVRFPVTGSLYLATCLVAGPAMFAAVGALVSQLAANRRQANALGAGVIGTSYLVRMVADSTSGWAGLRWASPLGWSEQLHPLTGSQPLALVPIVVLTVATAGAAALVAARRDLGASALPSRDSPPPRTALLGGPTGLAVRLVRPVAIGWAAGMAIFGLVLGMVANAAASAIDGSSTIRDAIVRLGGQGSGVKAYLGIAFGTVAALVAFAAAGQVNATRAEEGSEHLDHLLVRPVSRTRWLAGRTAVASALVVGISLVSGLASWLGTATQGGGVGLGGPSQGWYQPGPARHLGPRHRDPRLRAGTPPGIPGGLRRGRVVVPGPAVGDRGADQPAVARLVGVRPRVARSGRQPQLGRGGPAGPAGLAHGRRGVGGIPQAGPGRGLTPGQPARSGGLVNRPGDLFPGALPVQELDVFWT